MALNPTYKHLEASLRIAGWTVGQWAQVLGATVLALLFGVYVSPLPLTLTIFCSIVLAGSPLALSYGAMAQEWSVSAAVGAQWRWLRRPRRYLPGPSTAGRGYLVLTPADTAAEPPAVRGTHDAGERAALWDV